MSNFHNINIDNSSITSVTGKGNKVQDKLSIPTNFKNLAFYDITFIFIFFL